MTVPHLNATETTVLAALQGANGDYCFRNFTFLSRETGLDRQQVRRACRSLARKGLAVFGRGLWTEDGTPAGSGYAAAGKDGAR
ncbi:DNA-binding MarR family transcriptional regulator [Rhodoblastus acidophilus]|nr:DNA-binding MarR family transcriptional regulator [Rhodoblastus acidophilus]